MKLVDFGTPEECFPLERGEAMKQFYQNEDTYAWWNPMDWNYSFWMFLVMYAMNPGLASNAETSMLLMGGEL